MSELVIKGDGSFASVPVCDAGDPPDYDLVQLIPISVEFGTQETPTGIWSSGSCSLDCYSYVDTGGYIHYMMKWSPLPGWSAPPTPPYYTEIGNVSEIYIGCYKTGTNAYVGWCLSENNFPYSNGTMFNGTYANLEQSITEIQDWDESPAADENNPDNMLAMGGEFAETDPFGFGNEDMEIPNSVLELDYSSFITAYTCDDAAIGNIGTAIFSDNTWQNMKLKFEGVGNPIDYIISAVEIPYSPGGSGKNFNLGGVDIETANGNKISVSVMANRYYRLNFGSITLKETWGTEKDYSTTDVAIYLPYVGVKDLDASILVNSTITVVAWLDAWTGDLLYLIQVSNKARAYKYLASSGILYHFQGNCGKQVPIGRADNSAQTLALFGALGSMGVGLMSGNVGAALGGAAGLIGAAAMSPKVSMAGGISGAIGRGDQQDAWLIIKQSVPIYPANWRAHFGAPRFQTFRLGDLNGFVKCYDVHAEIAGANEAERAAIEQALKAGVFVNV